MSRTKAGSPHDPRGKERFNEEKATYTVKGSDDPATGFSLYMDPLLDALGGPEADEREILFLPLGHDRDVGARLRAIGWRTVAAVSDSDDARALGCSHVLDGTEPKPL